MPKIYAANDIARYLLACSEPDAEDFISNLKLQKLCYYAQGFALALLKRPFFNEPIEAWTHGPVVPELYHLYKDSGKEAIQPVTDLDFNLYDKKDRKLLDEVYDYYGQFSAWRLRNMTHEEKPWKDAFNRLDKEIHPEEMKKYFKEHLVN
ncbi:MAG: hypothetical protein JWR80_3927 [Bradyrhizobium sp.]|nr:hypothetical protein [Bradyrhizobium sp.]